MNVIENNRISRDFLRASNLQNNRALINELWPNSSLKARSNAELIELVDVNDLEVSPESFRRAMWRMADGACKGAYHVGLSAMPGFHANNGLQKARDGHAQVVETYGSTASIVTGRPLDARLEETPRGTDVLILYLGEAEAEIYSPDQNRVEEIHGERYTLKAYRQMVVPVISLIRLGAFNPFAWTITRAIHRSSTPTNEAAGLRDYMEQLLQLPFPPYAGIADGIKALWGTRIEAKQFNVADVDGTRLSMARGPGTLNQASIDAEQSLRSWSMDSGSLKFDGAISFRVNTGKAIFSFGQSTSWEQAQDVLHAIISAAP